MRFISRQEDLKYNRFINIEKLIRYNEMAYHM